MNICFHEKKMAKKTLRKEGYFGNNESQQTMFSERIMILTRGDNHMVQRFNIQHRKTFHDMLCHRFICLTGINFT